MSYIVFARKYRPQTFDDVVGQSHITTTLKNAIEQSRVAHAYIFAGPRGVGKTTTARIFAKALNCEKGPSAKPCNACGTCKEITQGSSLDILEIDGASNRGIEEIRSLRENIKFAPSKGRFKIYIIDEVHMLTSEAFNALLKTLEEPPPHVKFIFATTAPHKVPATILSRCQRFDFRRISTRDLAENLKMIAKDQKVEIAEEALGLIARYGDGSMRDAQVILDQMASFALKRIDAKDVNEILGIVDDEILFGISDAISRRDAKNGLQIIDRLIDDGKDPLQVALELIAHFRDISVAKICGPATNLIDAGPDKVARYRSEGEKFSIEEALYIVYTFSNAVDFMRRSSIARIPFEAAIIKLTQIPSIIDLPEIVSRIESLEKSGRTAPADGRARSAVSVPAAPGAVNPPRAASRGGGDRPVAVDADAGTEETGKPDPANAPAKGPVRQEGPAALASPDLEEVAGCWAKVVSHIKPKKISIASYLQEGYPDSLASNVLTVAFPKDCQFHKEVLDSPDNRRIIESAIMEVTGMDLRVELTLAEPSGRRVQDGPGNDKGPDGDDAPEGPDASGGEADPIVKAALDIFNGKIAGGGNGGRR